jgi:iron(III) transport system substrate-binding protein
VKLGPPLAGLALLAAAHGTAWAAMQPPVTIEVYSDRHHERDLVVFNGFTTETGIAVRLVDDEAEALFGRLETEGRRSPADMVLIVGAAAVERMAEHNMLAPLADDAALRAVPDPLRDGTRRWVALTWWARGVAYRTDRFGPDDVARYENLANGKFQGQLLVRSASSPYNHALVGAMIAADGIEDAATWARALVGNFARPPQGGDTEQIEALSRGEGGAAIVNTRYWARLAASDKVTEKETLDGLALALPNQDDRGSAIDIVAAGIPRSAPHARAAQQLIDYLLRPDVQAAIAASDLDFPVRADAAIPEPLTALGRFRPDRGSVRRLFKLEPDVQQVLAKADWD